MEKTHLLLRILAVIGRFGPHLTIVMIFVAQNNFKNSPGISDHLLGFYLFPLMPNQLCHYLHSDLH